MAVSAVAELSVEVGLLGIDGFVESFKHVNPEELAKDGAVEAFDEAVIRDVRCWCF